MKADNILYKTLQSISKKLDSVWPIFFSNTSIYNKDTISNSDQVIIRDSNGNPKRITYSNFTSGSYIFNNLIEWAQGKDYEPIDITRDSEGRITSMSVRWPDASSGIYTSTDYNATHEVYDGYTLTHLSSSNTVIQSAVTRNSEGAIINKPNLNII